jgi:UDP-N-acetylglucosamine--N-acetylmuramyl-(pentapeptide) pyrophosphoryl-undecaprenol N-acetylglucosamine transferase
MRGPMARPVVIAAGGTGGHFFPAEALCSELANRGHRVVLMTDQRSGALNSEAFRGREQFVLSGAGIAGRGAARAIRATAALATGTLQARRLLARLNASVVVGFGGYPSLPPVLASRLLLNRPAVVLHEQNAVLGRTNRALAGQADVLALSFPATSRVPANTTTSLTGNPVRPRLAALAGAPYLPPTDDGKLRLLVLGGSLGARVFSDVVPAALATLPAALRARLAVTQQCRAEDLDRVRAAYRAAEIDAELEKFFPAVDALLADAHLLVTRAGASTIAELSVAGRPAILVPLPGAIDDHQSANAAALADIGGAWVMPQPQLTPAALAARLAELFASPAALAHAAAQAATLARPDAASCLADLVERQIDLPAGQPAGRRDRETGGDRA